jgi:hypothetical protein
MVGGGTMRAHPTNDDSLWHLITWRWVIGHVRSQVNQNTYACLVSCILRPNAKVASNSYHIASTASMLFNIGVALVAIIPRLPNDPPTTFDVSYWA